MGLDRLAADLLGFGDTSTAELRKGFITVARMPADHEMKCQILEKNIDGLNRANNGRVAGNQCNRLHRQQQDSSDMSALNGSVTADCDKGKNRRPRPNFKDKCFRSGTKGLQE